MTGNRYGKIIAYAVFFSVTALIGAGPYAITVDIYQNMESGDSGTVLDSNIMNSSSFSAIPDITPQWIFYKGSKMWVSTKYARALPGEVVIGGKNYNSAGNRTWAFYNQFEDQYVRVNFGAGPTFKPHHDRMTIACFFTSDQTQSVDNQHDNIEIGLYPLGFAVLQTYGKLYLRAHSATDGLNKTTFSGNIKIKAGKTYWVNLQHDGIAGVARVAVFDPDTWKQLEGSPAEALSNVNAKAKSYAHFGNCSPHGNGPVNTTCSFFDHICIDYSVGAFPLLPDNVSAVHAAADSSRRWNPYAIRSLGRNRYAVDFKSIPGRINVFDLHGRMVLASPPRRSIAFIDLEGLPAGAYVIRASGSAQRTVFLR